MAAILARPIIPCLLQAVFVLLLGALTSMPLHASGLSEIRIGRLDQGSAGLFPGWVQQAPFTSRIEAPLELGDEPYDAILTLASKIEASEHRVSVQFETSMAIGDEGPHIDLLDWKHCTSVWKVLQPLAGGFVLPRPSEAESSCFPVATTEEIGSALKAALRHHGIADADAQRWLALAKSIGRPGEAPSYIGISKIRVRIEERMNGKWKDVTTVEFMPPLGC